MRNLILARTRNHFCPIEISTRSGWKFVSPAQVPINIQSPSLNADWIAAACAGGLNMSFTTMLCPAWLMVATAFPSGNAGLRTSNPAAFKISSICLAKSVASASNAKAATSTFPFGFPSRFLRIFSLCSGVIFLGCSLSFSSTTCFSILTRSSSVVSARASAAPAFSFASAIFSFDLRCLSSLISDSSLPKYQEIVPVIATNMPRNTVMPVAQAETPSIKARIRR